LTNSEIIDFQIGSPSMYQSAQCRGQYVYSRFRNIGNTFDMYANCIDSNNCPTFKYDENFTNSEVTYDGVITTTDDEIDVNEVKAKVIAEYNRLTGAKLTTAANITNLEYGTSSIYKILNRLPKNWIKPDIAATSILKNKKTLLRISNLKNSGNVEDAVKETNKLKERISQLEAEDIPSSYTIIPKIQSTYGFADLGIIYNADLSEFDDDPNGTTYVTTHKIGYEEKDRYARGADTCNSYLFLSPINHSDIQVDGDAFDSSKKLKSGESLRVPIVYQFRMTDYNGRIFGNRSLSENDQYVKNAKFANIIGIDIWTDRDSQKPKQYDIIVYSTYGSTVSANTSSIKTSSTQSLVNVGYEIVKSINKLSSNSKTIK
jgi:hypothetical protein